MLFESKKAFGMGVEATDGGFGKVEDFFFDEENWVVKYIIIQKGSFFHRQEFLVSPEAVSKLDFEDKKILVNLTKKQIEERPYFSTHRLVSRNKDSLVSIYLQMNSKMLRLMTINRIIRVF